MGLKDFSKNKKFEVVESLSFVKKGTEAHIFEQILNCKKIDITDKMWHNKYQKEVFKMYNSFDELSQRMDEAMTKFNNHEISYEQYSFEVDYIMYKRQLLNKKKKQQGKGSIFSRLFKLCG